MPARWPAVGCSARSVMETMTYWDAEGSYHLYIAEEIVQEGALEDVAGYEGVSKRVPQHNTTV